MEDDRVELEADIAKLTRTLGEGNQWQYDDYMVDSGDDSDEDDVLCIDLDKNASATASVASLSARSAAGRTGRSTPSFQSIGSQLTTETQSVTTDQDDDLDLFREVGVVLEKLDSGPPLPATLESCLVINQAYQDIIREHIGRIELELADNKEAQSRLVEEAKESSSHMVAKRRFPYAANLPYFKLRYGSTPAPNEDVKLKKLSEEPDLDVRPDKPWHLRHKKILIKSVTEDALEKLLQPLLSRRELEEEKLEKVAEKGDEWCQIKDRIRDIDKEIEEKRKTPQAQLLNTMDRERVDWMKIANITFQGQRDWQACRRAWQHSVDPKLNQKTMLPEEEARLEQLIKETNCSNWVYIAQQLGTGRTAFQCLQHYQQNMNPESTLRPWTKEEDQQLVKVVAKCNQFHFNWNKVSQYMEGRSGMQCYRRFTRLDPNINKGFWTEAEDGQLIAAVQLVGTTNWGRVSELVPRRTREQCRERYINSLDPKISGKPWTYEEDKHLLNLVKKLGASSWVKMMKDLPGRTDNQILQRYRRLEDWKRKSDWFKKQSTKDKELLQGNNLPASVKDKTQQKNWQQFADRFAVYPEDYKKQHRDMVNGEEPVPRPPFMLGLANKMGGKTWERRINLHKLIESHIDRIKERYNFSSPSVSGVFELQDAIFQLSKDCIAQIDNLLKLRKDRLGQLIHGLPSKLNVKDLLAVTRGGKVHQQKVRGPLGKRRIPGQIAPKLHKSMKIDSELRQVVRSNLKDRSLKKGRPRRFFWDLYGDQKLSDEDLHRLKATTLSLYLKSLGADLTALVVEGRKTFPERFHQLQAQQQQRARGEDDLQQPGPSHEGGQALRRSRRALQKKINVEAQAAGNDDDTNKDPFNVTWPSADAEGFSQWHKQKDYELLEWLASVQGLDIKFQTQGALTPDSNIPAAGGSMEVRTSEEGGDRTEQDIDPAGVGSGIRQVHASIQQALEESLSRQNQKADHLNSHGNGKIGGSDAAGEGQPLVGGGGDAHNTMSSQGQGRAAGPDQRPLVNPRQLPNLPPTSTSLQSFKQLLLRRLGLIKTAGKYYNLPYYLKKKDRQLAQLIEAGNTVNDLDRGTIDLTRMMNRFSQETNLSEGRKPRKPKGQGDHSALSQPDYSADRAGEVDHQVLEQLRQTEDYRLLESRFQAMFTWPALLAGIYPPFQRSHYSLHAGGRSTPRAADPDAPHFDTARKRLPLLKSKGFYKYANKSKEQKEAILQKRKEKRILKQVQELMADEDDPNPEVTLDPDSDDVSDEPSVASMLAAKRRRLQDDHDHVHSTPPLQQQLHPQHQQQQQQQAAGSSSARDSQAEATAGTTPPCSRKKNKKRTPGLTPVRQSARHAQRKIYDDRINRSSKARRADVKQEKQQQQRRPATATQVEEEAGGGREEEEEGGGAAAESTGEAAQEAPKEKQMRPQRLSKYIRNAMIDAMVTLQEAPSRHQHCYQLQHQHQHRHSQLGWNLGGYVSDDSDGGDVVGEMEARQDWVGQLPPDQRDSLAVLERHSIVDGVPWGTQAGSSASAVTASSTSARAAASVSARAATSGSAVTATTVSSRTATSVSSGTATPGSARTVTSDSARTATSDSTRTAASVPAGTATSGPSGTETSDSAVSDSISPTPGTATSDCAGSTASFSAGIASGRTVPSEAQGTVSAVTSPASGSAASSVNVKSVVSMVTDADPCQPAMPATPTVSRTKTELLSPVCSPLKVSPSAGGGVPLTKTELPSDTERSPPAVSVPLTVAPSSGVTGSVTQPEFPSGTKRSPSFSSVPARVSPSGGSLHASTYDGLTSDRMKTSQAASGLASGGSGGDPGRSADPMGRSASPEESSGNPGGSADPSRLEYML